MNNLCLHAKSITTVSHQRVMKISPRGRRTGVEWKMNSAQNNVALRTSTPEKGPKILTVLYTDSILFYITVFMKDVPD